jgi:hypothetical protein
VNSLSKPSRRLPWNNGKLIRAKPPLVTTGGAGVCPSAGVAAAVANVTTKRNVRCTFMLASLFVTSPAALGKNYNATRAKRRADSGFFRHLGAPVSRI